jgi:uncharacterized protein
MSGHLPLIGFGAVWHRRLRPALNQFTRPGYFFLLPMRSLRSAQKAPCNAARALQGLAINRRGRISFHDVDHGDGRSPQAGGALAWLEEQLAQAGIKDAVGEVWLQCYPRVLGYAFKPVSFWYCFGSEPGMLAAVVVEVNNTFGERHVYVLKQPAWGQETLADKVFHVSPFLEVSGHYRFNFLGGSMADGRDMMVRIDHWDDQGLLLATSQSGRLETATEAALNRAFWSYPAMTLGVVLHIHLQALGLWLKKVPWFNKPPPPASAVSPLRAEQTPVDAPGNP